MNFAFELEVPGNAIGKTSRSLEGFTIAAGFFCAVLFLSAFVLQGQDPPLSPKLVALQKELEAGNRAALENFWQEVTKQGAPLVEPIKGENRFVC